MASSKNSIETSSYREIQKSELFFRGNLEETPYRTFHDH